MSCKGICKRHKADRAGKAGHYEVGQKRCQTCTVFMYWEGLFCPCCGTRLRTKGRNNKVRTNARQKRLREQIKLEQLQKAVKDSPLEKAIAERLRMNKSKRYTPRLTVLTEVKKGVCTP